MQHHPLIKYYKNHWKNQHQGYYVTLGRIKPVLNPFSVPSAVASIVSDMDLYSSRVHRAPKDALQNMNTTLLISIFGGESLRI